MSTDISLFKLFELFKLILFKCSCSVGKYLTIKFKQVICSLPNKCIRCMFFTDSIELSKVFYKLVDILKFDNIVKLRTCLLALKILKKSSSIPSLFYDSLRAVSNLHKYNTRYASKGNFRRPKVRTNTGKFTFVYVASKLWETVPTNLKRLSTSSFEKRYENHLLKCQL